MGENSTHRRCLPRRRALTSSWSIGSIGAGVLGALLLVSCQRSSPNLAAKKHAQRSRRTVQGNHRVETSCAAGPALLMLKSGLQVEVCTMPSPGPASLAIVTGRPRAPGLPGGFVPIGPSFAVIAPDTISNASWLAESFEVRAGYRPVLTQNAGDVRLLDASYADARFRARFAPQAGSLLQFGLVPAHADGGVNETDAAPSRSAAP